MSKNRSQRLARAVAARLEEVMAHRPDRLVRSPSAPNGPMPVTFLVWNVFAMGGTVRTALRQASAFVDRGHEVTIVSVIRHAHQDEPFFALDPRLRVEILVDRRRLKTGKGPIVAVERWLDGKPALGSQISWGREAQGSLLTETRIVVRVLRARGMVVGTRVGLNLAVARFGHPAAMKVGQEHLEFTRYEAPLRRAMSRHFRQLEVLACLTEIGATAYRRALEGADTKIAVIPNAIPDQLPEPADLDAHRIVAVGRLAPGKGFHQLIEAFALIAPENPSWTLRIVGDGPQRQRLLELIARHELGERVELRRGTPAVQDELQVASVYALTSRFESFGMVLLEAMATGLAVVSYDCYNGPREILTHEHNALLVPTNDVRAFAQQLARMMADRDLRERIARAARRDVQTFSVTRVTDRWTRLLAEDAGRRGRR